jgi:endonuclease/exonuclease/phosphatase (EEP) superfamily protein YafD
LLGLAVGLRWIGEHNVTFAFLLYVPRQIFLLPLPFLAVLTLFFHWRLVPLQIVAGIAFAVFGMGWQPRRELAWSPQPAVGEITVLSYNRGQHANHSLQPFKNRIKPDLIVFQEAPMRAQRYAKAEGYEEFSDNLSEGEFTLLSRFPIVCVKPVRVQSADRDVTVAARYEIDIENRRVALYAVHFATPRDILRYYIRGAFLYGVIGLPGTPFHEKRKQSQVYWDDRISQARQLMEIVRKDPLPVLAAGDFNAPSGGAIHGLVTATLTDSHLAAGSGFGFTFPGATRNPLSRGGPWMRIDYIFSSSHWTPIAAVAEAERPSQHRAVAARFAWADAAAR